jgi:hypothetical protein
MKVELLPAAVEEAEALPERELRALSNALEKLRALGETLGFPHSSAVKSATGTLRELRPRQGQSPWRAFYRRVGDVLVVAAVGPEASVDPRGFDRAVQAALERLAGEEKRTHA